MAETAAERLEKAFYEAVATHTEANNYLWLGAMVKGSVSFPQHVGTLTSRTPFVIVHKSLWGFYRCQPLATSRFAELESEAMQAFNELLNYLAPLTFDGLHLRLFGDVSRIHVNYDPLSSPDLRPFVRLLDVELGVDLIQDQVQKGSARQWIETTLVQPGTFYKVEAMKRTGPE